MKKRNKIFLVATILFLFTSITNATYVQFTNPTDGETKTWIYDSETTIPVNLQYHKSSSSQFGCVVKLIDHEGTVYRSSDDDGIPQWWYLAPGTYTWTLKIYDKNYLGQEFYRDTDVITFHVKHSLEVRNNFVAGIVEIDDTTKPSTTSVYKYINDNLSVGAIDQRYNGDMYVWQTTGSDKSKWDRKPKNGNYGVLPNSETRNYNYSVQTNDNGATIRANMRIDAPPAAPQNVNSTSSNNHPKIYWTANIEPDLNNYRIYKDGSYLATTSNTYYVDNIETLYSPGGDNIKTYVSYKVKAVDNNNSLSDFSNSKSVAVNGSSSADKIVADEKIENVIEPYELFSNYPNPFNPTTNISYQIPQDGFVNLVVYNALGQEVAQLVNQNQSTGNYSVEFNATNLPSGVYIYKLQANEFSSTKKMLLTK